MDTGLKYLNLANWIRENIENNTFKVGEKLISENQLCERFAISRQTVRQAIAILEKEGLVTRRRGSGTYINDSGKEKSPLTGNIGLITTYLDDYIFPSIISGVEKVLSKKNYNMLLRLTRNKVHNERLQLLTLLDSDVDGLIVEGTKTALPNPNLDLYRKFLEHDIPVIFINAYYPEMPCNFIVNDDVLGARLATRSLIEHGHEKIAGIFKHDDLQGNWRYKGFIDEMYEHNLPVDDQRLLWFSTESQDDLFTLEKLPFLMKIIKDSTAVICYNDQIAMKLIQLINQDFPPRGLSFVSFDNSPLGNMSVIPLSSITHPGKELGKMAAESILTMIENPSYKVCHTFEPLLVQRDSIHKIAQD